MPLKLEILPYNYKERWNKMSKVQFYQHLSQCLLLVIA